MNQLTKQTEKGLMTEGAIYKQLLLFSLPLLLGNLFQQLYNMVDSIVVGNFIGGTALAAVGAGAAVINLLIGMFTGLTTGAGVVISQFFGSGDSEKVRQSVHTAAAFTLIFGLVLSIAGVLLTDHILHWTNTPPEVFDQASLYLRIFFSGMILLSVYNMGAAILRAVGDSTTPLYYLGAACLLNILLDILFVTRMGMGVEGAAFATLIAQAAAAILVVCRLIRCKECYGLIPRKITVTPSRLKRILIVGVPTGVQQMIISLSNVIVQGYVNGFGSDAMAGWSAYGKLDGLLLLPIMSFGLAMTTFTGQNIGAKRLDRVQQGVRTCLLMSCSFALITTILMYLFGGHILKVFSDEPNVLRYGVIMLRGMIPFYFLLSIIQIFSGVVSGSGHSFASMLIMVINMCVLRVAVLWFLASRMDDVTFIFIAYVVSWFTCAAGLVFYYWKGNWKQGFLEKEAAS